MEKVLKCFISVDGFLFQIHVNAFQEKDRQKSLQEANAGVEQILFL